LSWLLNCIDSLTLLLCSLRISFFGGIGGILCINLGESFLSADKFPLTIDKLNGCLIAEEI
jgi:hypothetical protein